MSNPFDTGERTVAIAGRDVTIKEVRMRDLQQVSRICAPFFDAFDSTAELSQERAKIGKTSDTLLYRLLAEHADQLMVLTTILTDAPRDWIDALAPDEFFVLAAEVVAANASFFIVRLFPALQKMAEGIGRIGTTTASI